MRSVNFPADYAEYMIFSVEFPADSTFSETEHNNWERQCGVWLVTATDSNIGGDSLVPGRNTREGRRKIFCKVDANMIECLHAAFEVIRKVHWPGVPLELLTYFRSIRIYVLKRRASWMDHHRLCVIIRLSVTRCSHANMHRILCGIIKLRKGLITGRKQWKRIAAASRVDKYCGISSHDVVFDSQSVASGHHSWWS